MKNLCVDFDGVIHSYESGWAGADTITDGPVPGALTWLKGMIESDDIRVFIYSSRSCQPGGIEAMKAWFKKWFFKSNFAADLINGLEFPTEKPPAFLTIDDRAFCFNGVFPSIREIKDFRTWQQKER